MTPFKIKEFTKPELEQINNLFTHYIFYKTMPDGSRFCTCSGCGKEFNVGNNRLTTSEEYELIRARHNDGVRCPHCKRMALLKNEGKAKGCANLYEEQRVVVIKFINKNYVQAVCKIAYKEYGYGHYNPQIRFLSYNQSVYTFRPKEVQQFKKDYYSGWYEQRTPTEPFNKKTTMWYNVPDNHYTLIGAERLKNSFLKYNMLNEFYNEYVGSRDSGVIEVKMMSYLCRFCEYPQIEILQKLGYYEIVFPLVLSGLKSFPYVDWKANDLPSFFKLSKQEYKAFKSANGGLDLLKVRWDLKKLTGDDSIKTALKYYELIYSKNKRYYFDNLMQKCEEKGLPIFETLKYLAKQYKTRKVIAESIMREYFDYYDMAQKLRYDLQNPVVRYPKNLQTAHDNAVANYNAHKAEIEAKQNAKKEAAAKKMLQSKDRQYCYSDDNFMILVPHTIADIIREGKIQKHCVGGYAARHMDGKLTICFLREINKPKTPLYTIEMHDRELTQVQGAGNCTPLTPEAKKFFETWLKWVKGGSRRNKNGEPIIRVRKTA